MRVTTLHTTQADQASAQLFFQALFGYYDFTGQQALEAFARNGELTLACYASRFPREQLECWELGTQHEETLRQFTDRVRIGCSYRHLSAARAKGEKYGLIVIDTPQGVHLDHEGRQQVEHFGFLRQSLDLIGDTGVVVLYVNKRPYNRDDVGSHGYDEYAEYDYDRWMKVRRLHYGSKDITEVQALQSYSNIVARRGLEITSTVIVPCFSDVQGLSPYAFRLGLALQRRGAA